MATTKAFATLLSINVPDNQKRDQNRTIYTDSIIPNQENNLADWLIDLEIENTGVSNVNSGEITLRIDERGTFVRSNPVLVNEDAKNKYLIELQLKQDLDNDGNFNDPSEQGIVLRGFMGSPSVIQNSSFGEILRIPLTSIQYRLKEMPTSRWHLFQSPRESFNNRVAEIGLTPNNYPVRDNTVTNNLPTSPLLSYKPTNPMPIHDTMANIITDLANPQVEGGSFDDYYFEIENDSTKTNYLNITADKYGVTDSGVVIDPLSLDIEDTGEENTTITDNLNYKNHAILIGDTKSGSLPMERSRFASKYEHARIRSQWDSSTTYQSGDLVKVITTTPTNLKPYLITYHRSLTDNNTGNNPLTTHGTNWEIDFTDIPPFVTTSSAYYKQGEIVTHTAGFRVGFYQCNTSGTYATNHFYTTLIPNSPNGWNFITDVGYDDYEPFVSYSPWTNDVDIWKQTLAGTENGTYNDPNLLPTIDSQQYAGFAWDWNVTKSNFNRENLNSSFEEVSPKVITGFTSQLSITGENSVPNKEKYDSNRLLIDTSSQQPWSNNLNKIAEYDAETQTWQLSKQAVSGDTVINLYDGKIWKFNGSSWATKWDWDNSSDTDKPTPFHLVKNVGLVAGATNIAGQAVEFEYDWAVNLVGDDHINRTARGVWLCSTALLPRNDTNQYDIGELYGGTPDGTKERGTIDTNNYDFDRNGLQGWNKGIDDEDYGRISGIAFKMRVSFNKSRDGTGLIHGLPEIPMTFWAIDKFDRVWFHRFKLRRNGQWDDVVIPLGDLAPAQLYHARWDELATFLDGVPITGLDFTIKEREFSGIAFDWKYMKYWGVQLDESYTTLGLYKNGLERALEYGEDLLAELAGNSWYQIAATIYNIGGYITNGTDFQAIPYSQNFIRLNAKIAIDDLHFTKELLASSDDTTVYNGRTDIMFVGNERDYVNLKTRAKARVARKKFFPQTVHIRTSGDVRLRFGHSFKVSGSRVIENPNNYPAYNALNTYSVGDKISHGGYTYEALQNVPVNITPPDNTYWENLNKYTVSNVKHQFGHDGYYCQVTGFRKFVVSG